MKKNKIEERKKEIKEELKKIREEEKKIKYHKYLIQLDREDFEAYKYICQDLKIHMSVPIQNYIKKTIKKYENNNR